MINNIIVNLIWAVLILVLGCFLAKKAGIMIENLLKKIRLNQAVKNLGWHAFFERYKTRLNVSKFFGLVFEGYLFLIVMMISTEILNLMILSNFFLNIVNYYPNIFIASIIFIIAVFFAEFSKKIVYADADLKYSNTLSILISGSAWVLAGLAILYQLKIVPDLILALFRGVTLALALAFGISFGLGAKDLISKFLKEFFKKIK
ncbi:MAG: hypothetical protein WC157_02295 [Candidatus Paceibacterota bacterium]